jgi:hypothetical protein
MSERKNGKRFNDDEAQLRQVYLLRSVYGEPDEAIAKRFGWTVPDLHAFCLNNGPIKRRPGPPITEAQKLRYEIDDLLEQAGSQKEQVQLLNLAATALAKQVGVARPPPRKGG